MATVLHRRFVIAVVVALGLAVPAAAQADTVTASVSSTPTGQVMGNGYLGVSFEFRALHQYTGNDPRAVDPVLLSLLSGLAPGQSPVIRVGGNSTDGTWWPIRGTLAPGGVYYPLNHGWLRSTQALAADLHAKLILGINLAAGRPAFAAAEGRAFVQGIGKRYISDLEIGNEPDLYGVFPWYRDARGHLHKARGRGYKLAAYTKQFTQWSRVLPSIPLAGPAVSGPTWMKGLGGFIHAEPRLGMVTYHRYPLRECTTNPSDPSYPSIPHLLADSSSSGLAKPLAGFAATAHHHRKPFRVAEMNSASCEGAKGVSDTFASALWALDTMFQFQVSAVDGVNFHMLPGSNYELFTVSHNASGQWQAFVHPEYYGLQLFAQAFPPGARRLKVSAPGGPVKVWATKDASGNERITIINKDGANGHDVAVQVAGATTPAQAEGLTAPSVSATDGVSLGGQTYGEETTTGRFAGQPQTTPIAPVNSTYTVPMPAGSATLLTIPAAPGGGSSGL